MDTDKHGLIYGLFHICVYLCASVVSFWGFFGVQGFGLIITRIPWILQENRSQSIEIPHPATWRRRTN